MFRKCCVDSCESVRSKSTVFHCFPRPNTPAGRERLLKWLRRFKSDELRRMDFETIQKLYICHLHFENKFIKDNVRLHPGGYPNLFTEQEIKTGVPDIPISTHEDDRKKGVKTDHSNYTKQKHEDHSYAKTQEDTDSISRVLWELQNQRIISVSTSDQAASTIQQDKVVLKELCQNVCYGVPLHRFPNPVKHPELYAAWVKIIDKKLLESDPMKVYKGKRVCDHHFDPIYKLSVSRLKRTSIPSVNLHRDTAFKKDVHQKIIDNKKLKEATKAAEATSETEEPADEPAVDDDDFKIPSPRMVPSPVPSMENESKEKVFSWQKSELIPADEVEEPLTAAELEEQSGVSLYCDENPAPKAESQVPETSVKEVEYRCKDCGEVINGFQFWCVQCFGCALCGACEARGEHNRHYVLRAPPDRPYRQTQLVLATIRHQLQNENMLTHLGADDDGVKLEVKEEPPEEEWRILDPAPAHVVASDDDPLRDESSISDDGLHPCKRPRLAAPPPRGAPLPVTVTSRPRPQEQVLINVDTRDQIEFIVEPEDVTIDDTEDHLDDSVDSSVHEDDAVSIDSRIDEDEATRIEKNNVTRDEEHLDDESVDSSVHEDDADEDVTRIEKNNVTRDEEHIDDDSVHADDADEDVTRIEKNNVTRDEYTEEHLDDESVDSSVHDDDVSTEETEITRIEEENVIRDTEEHFDNEDSVVSRIDETEITRIEDETIVETIEDDDGNVLEDDAVSILYTFEDDTLVISSDQIEIIRLEDDTDGVDVFESILSDLDRTVRREDDTGQLPVRGPPEAMLRTLPAEAVVKLQPLSSLDIRKWTAHSKKRRK